MKVVIYARVSTDDKEQNPERQLMQCKKYCEIHNHTIIHELVEYHTGDSNPFLRPIGKEILKLDAEGIVIASMDRLTRQHPVKVLQMISSLKDKGIKVVSVTEPAFNMESEFSDIIMFIIGWFNNYFLVKLKRDTKAGIERARKEGKQIGRAEIRFNIFRARELISQGLSLREVAKSLGVTKSTLHNRLRKGRIVDNEVIYKENLNSEV